MPSTAHADTGCDQSDVFTLDNRYAIADLNLDGYVDQADLERFIGCATGPGVTYDPGNPAPTCDLVAVQAFLPADFDHDTDIDQLDFALFQRCWSGPEPADPNCGN